MMRIILSFLISLVFVAPDLFGQTDNVGVLRPVTSIFSLRTGSAEVADTYLSPIIYNGWGVGFNYERMQAMKFSPEKWVMSLTIDIETARSHNKVRNATMWQADISAEWAMLHRWTITKNLILGAGGFTGISAGGIYTARNGNNPASAKGSWHLGLRAYATYAFKCIRNRAMVRWNSTLPLTGVFFSPAYGELYYEIWLGNHSGLVHGAWPGNYFRLNNEISFDIELGTTWLKVGYRSGILSTKVNDITSRIVTNSFVLGLSTQWVSLKGNTMPSLNTRIITALY